MKIKHIIILLLALSPLLAIAQVDFMEEKNKINSIKKNPDYIYGEGIADTEQEATSMSESALRSEIMRVISEEESLQDTETILVNAVKRNSTKIELKRGSMDRIFLYVSKNNILAGDQVMTIERQRQEITIEEDNGILLADEPLPTNEVGEVIEVVDDEVIEIEDLEELAENTDEPIEISIAEIPAEETETKTESQVVEVDSPILSKIISTPDMAALQAYMKELKADHKIMWGDVRSEINPTWYIIAYTTDGEIKAILDKGINKRTNLLTGEKVELSNYSNTRKVWFIIYE